MAEKKEKLGKKELIREALKTNIRLLRAIEKTIEKAAVTDKEAKRKISLLVFGREIDDTKSYFAKRVGFLKLALKELEVL